MISKTFYTNIESIHWFHNCTIGNLYHLSGYEEKKNKPSKERVNTKKNYEILQTL